MVKTLHFQNAGGISIPGQETGIPHAAWYSQINKLIK